MADLQKELAPRGLAIVGICDDTPENQRAITEPAGVRYPLLVETEEIPAPFDSVGGFPSFLLVDRDGTIVGPVLHVPGRIERTVRERL